MAIQYRESQECVVGVVGGGEGWGGAALAEKTPGRQIPRWECGGFHVLKRNRDVGGVCDRIVRTAAASAESSGSSDDRVLKP